MRSLFLTLMVVSGLSAVACFDGGNGNGNGDDEESVYLDDATVTCDPTASAWDDLFIFEAVTSGPVEEVDVQIWNGATDEGTWEIDEAASGNWYGELYGEDINSDCDDWNSMSFEFTAWGDEDSDSAQVLP